VPPARTRSLPSPGLQMTKRCLCPTGNERMHDPPRRAIDVVIDCASACRIVAVQVLSCMERTTRLLNFSTPADA
jgi:hypothetical protein